MATQGWKVHSKETAQQGYSGGKTCCLGVIFLPLALLGKKNNIITVIFERDTATTPPVAVEAQTVTQQPAPPKPATTTPAKPKATVAHHKATQTKPASKPKRKV